MNWIVHIHDGAARQLKAIPPDRRQGVLKDIAAFEVDPFRGLVKPLKGKGHKGHYRTPQ
jgi:mRNA-degrading endonuclease RelE of RelBE toxin-antitoxin system